MRWTFYQRIFRKYYGNGEKHDWAYKLAGIHIKHYVIQTFLLQVQQAAVTTTTTTTRHPRRGRAGTHLPLPPAPLKLGGPQPPLP